MTKTQRRRAARAIRQQVAVAVESAASRDYAAARKLLRDPKRWKLLDDALLGLVTIEFTTPFIDMELLCPEHGHLVVELDLVQQQRSTSASTQIRSRRRPQPSLPDLPSRVARALDALATLCTTAQCLSRWDDLYHSFWERVAESDMLAMLLEAPMVDKWVRFTKARGLPLLLSWSNRPFLPELMTEPLGAFLWTPRPAYGMSEGLPVTVGLRFVKAAMTTSVMESLHELLQIPSRDSMALLVESTSLRTLWFDSNPFYAPELSVLAATLIDPSTRRVDELKLENFIVDESPAVAEPAFGTALSRVFTSACAIKTSDAPTAAPTPLSLSIGGNTLFLDHLDTVREAIAQSARPLRSLSLAGVYPSTEIAWKSLTDLVFCPLPTVTPCAVLNLTDVSSRTQFSQGLALLVRNFVESMWSTGVLDDRSIECSVSSGTTLSEGPARGCSLQRISVPSRTFLAVEDYNPASQYLKVVFPTSSVEGETELTTGWVSVSNVTQLRHAGTLVVGSSFTRLIYDGPNRFDYYNSDTLVQLTTSMGPQLRSLALERHQYRWWFKCLDLRRILHHCPHLRELSLERSLFTNHGEEDLWDEREQMPSLHILNVSCCGLRDVSLRKLSALPTLRYLQLQGNPIGAVGVESLLNTIRTNHELETVELNHQYSDTLSLSTRVRAQIDAHLDRDYLHPRDKAAVLSVLNRLQRQNPRLPFPGNDVVGLVFAFVGTKPRRVVKWY